MNINLTLIGQSISFFMFVWFCMKFVWPPIMEALEARQKEIADGLAAAERGVHAHELAEKKAVQVIHEAKEQAADIVAQAQKRASDVVSESKEQAGVEGKRIVAAAQAEVEQAENQAKEKLRARVAELAVAGAEKILAKEIDAKAHSALLDKLVKQL